MKVGKGDIRGQRQRRRERYRGCRVCGVRDQQCTDCDLGAELVKIYGCENLTLFVDGSFVASRDGELGHGGAGLVLVHVNEVIASRACGFRAQGSTYAELHAIIRAGRWAPGVVIYTDARDLPEKAARSNPNITVRYLPFEKRGAAHALAHRLSVEGRCREAPETIPAVGIEFAAARVTRSKAQRRRMGAELLLDQAGSTPNFDGDFFALAERLGWTAGRRWRDNPAIRIASQLWEETK